ncbi:helix-turn-helix domain-containing protein [Sorangium sp. So ce1014]|uniref:helix-turn-helix domain-containing protein n=1 Tax=Sorangium sp. So ce1014 TaxID=3133326 RepID=UPI003F63F0E6
MTVTWRTREELVLQLVTLHRQGLSSRAIARALGVSRNTVKALLAADADARDKEHKALLEPPPRAPRASKVDAYAARVAELMARYPDITAQRIFETLREDGYRFPRAGAHPRRPRDAALARRVRRRGHRPAHRQSPRRDAHWDARSRRVRPPSRPPRDLRRCPRRLQGEDTMPRRQSSGIDPPLGDDVVAERLRRHLGFLGLTRSLARLDELLAWATRERRGATALLEHVLGAGVASKVEARVARRVVWRSRSCRPSTTRPSASASGSPQVQRYRSASACLPLAHSVGRFARWRNEPPDASGHQELADLLAARNSAACRRRCLTPPSLRRVRFSPRALTCAASSLRPKGSAERAG